MNYECYIIIMDCQDFCPIDPWMSQSGMCLNNCIVRLYCLSFYAGLFQGPYYFLYLFTVTAEKGLSFFCCDFFVSFHVCTSKHSVLAYIKGTFCILKFCMYVLKWSYYFLIWLNHLQNSLILYVIWKIWQLFDLRNLSSYISFSIMLSYWTK